MSSAVEQKRDKASGQYAPSLDKPCTCSHRLGQHTAVRVAGEQPCTECDCESYRRGK